MAESCFLGHRACERHPVDMPGLDREPRPGRCVAGHASIALWIVPLDGMPYCTTHLRQVLRVATWPNAIRVPEEE